MSSLLLYRCTRCMWSECTVPVKMFWKAVSTLVESNAEVSMKDSVFFSGEGREHFAGYFCASLEAVLRCYKNVQASPPPLPPYASPPPSPPLPPLPLT